MDLSMRAPAQQVIVVRHQAVGVDLQPGALAGLAKATQKEVPVGIITKNGLTPETTVHQVVPTARVIKSWFPSHDSKYRTADGLGKLAPRALRGSKAGK
jgi:hypothetical protein